MEFRLVSFQERKRLNFQRRNVWHRWFAWRPTRIDHETVVWFKTIMRKCIFNSLSLRVQYSKYARLDDPQIKEGSLYP